tara:strand:- start:650 stop:1237 length:588 start_codon:yes stop_codon:yes gene_type:complete
MKPFKDFIVSPIGDRYNNIAKVGDKSLILNTDIYNHEFVNRQASVIATPLLFSSPIKVGDEIIIHHNVFRRWNDMKGKEKNSRSYLKENHYLISPDQVYLYKRKKWNVIDGYTYIKPIVSNDKMSFSAEEELIGIVKYSDGTFDINEVVGYRPRTVVEDFVDGERLYRVMNKFITIKYGHKGNKKEYNPSWTQSG